MQTAGVIVPVDVLKPVNARVFAGSATQLRALRNQPSTPAGEVGLPTDVALKATGTRRGLA
jgi:hypothetical protein